MALRIILTTGGTGGHIFPALAVAEALRRKEPDIELLFIGGLYGPEKELVEKAPYKILSIQVDGGSEFMKEFEETCQELGIELFVLHPVSPKYNGGVSHS